MFIELYIRQKRSDKEKNENKYLGRMVTLSWLNLNSYQLYDKRWR